MTCEEWGTFKILDLSQAMADDFGRVPNPNF